MSKLLGNTNLGYTIPNIEYGVHFTFLSLPDNQEKKFQKEIEQTYFEDFRQEVKQVKEYLYRPIKYYLLGDYDLCYITLINNFKFAHQLFEPITKNEKGTTFKPHSSLSYSGFALDPTYNVTGFFQDQSNIKDFIGIINLKIDNGLLIGNGITLIERIHELLKFKYPKKEYLLVHTFSWFDFSLILFINDPNELSLMVSELILWKPNDLDNSELLKNSLYAKLSTDEDELKDYTVFSDTQSYLGFNKDLIEKKLEFERVVKFLTRAKTIKFEAEIEFQVNPGHEFSLTKYLADHKYLSPKEGSEKLVFGKYDYQIQFNNDTITAIFHLIRDIYKKQQGLFSHIRKVRTRVLYPFVSSGIEVKMQFPWSEHLSKLAQSSDILFLVNERLKALKISRQVRLKILKIIVNYNNGIQDVIQFPYFMDFTVFIKNLIDLIEEEFTKSEKGLIRIKELEDRLSRHVEIFQNGYDVRFLNGYQFENISDFNLDFNSSIQQILTSYSTLIYEYGKLFYNKNFGQVIQLNNVDTISNYKSINYSIHHLTSPEFVFSTILKEILNQIKEDNVLLKNELDKLKADKGGFFRKVNESYLDDMIENGLVDFEYFFMDIIRYKINFRSDFRLFYYWFWAYNFQNPSLYDSGGMFNEDHLRKEMLRIALIRDYFKLPKNLMGNPSPELFTLWDRHILKIEKISKSIVKYLRKSKIQTLIDAFLYEFFNRVGKSLTENSSEFDIEFKDFDRNKKNDLLDFLLANLYIDELSGITISSMLTLIHETLVWHFNMNNGKVTLLRRNWKNGLIISNYDKLYDTTLYAIDQTGGVYFNNCEKMDEYFKQNVITISSIIDFSLIKKESFFLKEIKQEI